MRTPIKFYSLDNDRNVIVTNGLRGLRDDQKIVGRDYVADLEISTCFIGGMVDLKISTGPLVFETMFFKNYSVQEPKPKSFIQKLIHDHFRLQLLNTKSKYQTWRAALDGHEAYVRGTKMAFEAPMKIVVNEIANIAVECADRGVEFAQNQIKATHFYLTINLEPEDGHVLPFSTSMAPLPSFILKHGTDALSTVNKDYIVLDADRRILKMKRSGLKPVRKGSELYIKVLEAFQTKLRSDLDPVKG